MLVVTQPLVRVGVLDYGLGLAPREPRRFRIIREQIPRQVMDRKYNSLWDALSLRRNSESASKGVLP